MAGLSKYIEEWEVLININSAYIVKDHRITKFEDTDEYPIKITEVVLI